MRLLAIFTRHSVPFAFLSLRAERSNLTENAEVLAIDYGIHGLR